MVVDPQFGNGRYDPLLCRGQTGEEVSGLLRQGQNLLLQVSGNIIHSKDIKHEKIFILSVLVFFTIGAQATKETKIS